ncbi:uridine kinase [Arthrobacter pigmenti]|uniref:Uridine kinase n=2 Tax=Arthrobacter pigmenti TaxID=271432 RepID=A0A846RRM4_9MICC|nr:uridine kinase [Arthrobacter pigmenti]
MGRKADDGGVLATVLRRAFGGGRVLVGVDGVDGSGKTTFADSLAALASRDGRAVVRIGLDNFLKASAVRYRRGRDSPEGFWLDSYNYGRFREWVLEPLRGDGFYREACHDLATDSSLCPPLQQAPSDCLVLIDGMFLHRDELAGVWDVSVFLDVPFTVTAERMAIRDGSNPDPEHLSMRRYVQGQRLYLGGCDPASRATFVVDNSDPGARRFVEPESVSYRA